MLHDNILILTFILLFQKSFSYSVCEKNDLEDANVIAKEVEKKFKYVKKYENFTMYLLNDYDVSIFAPLLPIDSERPDFLDWREKNMIGPVKDQKRCNACWAFSTVACIESHLAIYEKKKVQLSEQFLIDCVGHDQPDAPKCGRYSLIKAYSEIISEFGGVLAQGDYRPYSGQPGQCAYSKPPPYPLPVSGFARVTSNEDAMAEALFAYGPLSAAINDKSMAKYKGNYIDQPSEEDCSPRPENLNHAVLIVGYNRYVGKDGQEVPYWIIKNSWGEDWGDHGYYYLERGRNACGIANDVSYAIVPKPNAYIHTT